MSAPRPIFGYWTEAIAPMGAARIELIAKLKEENQINIRSACITNAKERAQELCLGYNDDELYMRSGDFIWTIYEYELYSALRKAMPRKNWRTIDGIMTVAKSVLVYEVEAIRRRRNVITGVSP